MSEQEYYLILPARLGPSSYGGGWAAGSVIAHWFHLEKGNPGVFWVWPLTSSGIKYEHKPLLDSWKVPLGEPTNQGFANISRKGFFYESNTHSIAWQFEAECIIRTWPFLPRAEETIKELKRLEDCIPLFRQEYLKAWWADFKPWGDWLLIRKLKRLKMPIFGHSINGGFCFPSFKYFSNSERKIVSLNSAHLRGGDAFIVKYPDGPEVVDPDPEMEINNYLKQFLMDNPPRGKLREINIHEVFILKLLREGHFIINEGKISKGRYDVLFKDKNDNFIAVEFKLREGDPAVDQLQDYIDKLQKDYGTKIQGVIVCGHADEKLKSRAKKNGFKVIEYKLTIDIPFQEVIA